MKRLAVGLVLALTAITVDGGVAAAQSVPVFKLGFKVLADQIPDVVGVPLENEGWGANGDSLQHTSTGLMVWRKSDNWTAFTNGYQTWVNGPYGLEERLNSQRFGWELSLTPPNDLFNAPATPPAATAAPLSATATPQAHQGLPPDAVFVKATDSGIYVLRRGYRWVMPDWDTYLAYGGAPDLSNVRAITDQELAATPWGGALSNIWVDTPVPLPTPAPTQAPMAAPLPNPTQAPTSTVVPIPNYIPTSFHILAGKTQMVPLGWLNTGQTMEGYFSVNNQPGGSLDIAFEIETPHPGSYLHDVGRVQYQYFHETAPWAGNYTLFFDNSYASWYAKDVVLNYRVY